MKKITILASICALALLLAVSTALPQDLSKLKYPKLGKIEIPDIEKVTLDNGISLYLLENHELPTFRMAVQVHVGSYLEPAEKIGLVDILGNTMRTGGTEKWTGDELDEVLESVGASVETFGGVTGCGARVNTLSDQIDLGIDVLSQVLMHPQFAEDKVELARVQARSAIARRNDSPIQIAIREFLKMIFGADSPYARQTEIATIDAIAREDLLAFHQRYFRPNMVQMAVWGDFDKDEIVEKLNAAFADWQPTTEEIPEPPKVNYDYRQQVFLVDRPGSSQSTIIMGHIGGLMTDEDYATHIVMNNVLGGGLGGRVFNRVRTKDGLAYTAQSAYTSGMDRKGIMYGLAMTAGETTVKAGRKIVEVLYSMHTEPPSDDEMIRGKDSYLNSFVFNFDETAELVNRIMDYDHTGYPEDFLQQVKEKVETVTADDVVAAAQKVIKPDQMVCIVVGDTTTFDMSLDSLGMGPVTLIDVTIPRPEVEVALEINDETMAQGSEVIAQAIEAHGGQEVFDNLKTMERAGTMTISMQGRELPITFEEATRYPDQHRAVMSFMGQQMYDITSGKVGWKTDQMSGGIAAKTEAEIANEEAEERRDFIVMMKNSANPDGRFVYAGSDQLDDRDVDLVAMVDDADESICVFGFDAESHELACIRYFGETMMGQGDIEIKHSSLTDIGGILIPMKSVLSLDGNEIIKIVYSSAETNNELADSMFEEPKM